MSGSQSLLSVLWMLLCVVVIILLAYFFTRYVFGRGVLHRGLPGGAKQFKVLARLSLGREQAAELIQAGERYFLIGVASSGVSLLAELSQEEAEAVYQSPPSDQPPPPSFRDSLRIVLQQKKSR